MELTVVWRNPDPPKKPDQKVTRVVDYHSVVVYEVMTWEGTQSFLLISGEVA